MNVLDKKANTLSSPVLYPPRPLQCTARECVNRALMGKLRHSAGRAARVAPIAQVRVNLT